MQITTMIEFQCPTCRNDISVPKNDGGKTCTCSDCGERVRIPKAKVLIPSTQETRHTPQTRIVEGRTGQIEVLENSIRITRRGWLSTPKVGDKEILISSITAIELKPAGMLGKAGYIRFVFKGGGEVKKSFLQTLDPVMHATNDENAVLFGKGSQPDFEKLKRVIEKKMVACSRPQLSTPLSVADELTSSRS